MFKENAKIAYGMEQLVEHLRNVRRGETITHDAITKLSGIEQTSPQYATIRQRLRRHALKHFKFTLVAIPGVGYRIATPAEQANDAMQRSGRASRQLHRGIREISATPDDAITDHQRRVKNSKVQIFRAGRQYTRKAAHIEAALAKIPESLPRRPTQEAV